MYPSSNKHFYCFHSGAVKNKIVVNTHVGFLGHMATICWAFEELSNCFKKWFHQLAFLPAPPFTIPI